MILSNDVEIFKKITDMMKTNKLSPAETYFFTNALSKQIDIFGHDYHDDILVENRKLVYECLEKFCMKHHSSNLTGKWGKTVWGLHRPPSGAIKYIIENWALCLAHMGINVVVLDFGQDFKSCIKKYKITDFVTVGVPDYLNDIGDSLLTTKGLRIGYIYDSSMTKEGINDYYISFDINAKDKFLGKDVVSVPFGANPIIHFKRPAPKLFDYSFIGTLSYFKQKETFDYLGKITEKSNNGIFGGGNFPTGINYVSNVDASKIYAFSNICPNFHLKKQIEEANEVNDRTYSISSCGEFQIVDNPAIMKELYSDDEMCVVNNPTEYLEAFEHYLKYPKEKISFIKKGMKKTIENYTLFHRLEVLCDYLQGK